jgi:hypothetical protein
MKVRTHVIACVLAGLAGSGAGAATFSAQETHRGLVIHRAGSPAASLVPKPTLFRRPSDPSFVYREGGAVTAAVWESGSSAIVRSGTTESAPTVGRIVPSWHDNELMLSIEPADGAAIRTTVFKRTSCAGSSALDRDTSTREALEGTYVATLTGADGANVGSMSVDVDPQSATSFTGDLPPGIPAPLAAAAAQAVDAEVAFIYESVIDVSPTLRH